MALLWGRFLIAYHWMYVLVYGILYIQKQKRGNKMKRQLNKNSLNYEADKDLIEMSEELMLRMALKQKIYGGEYGKKRCEEIKELWYDFHPEIAREEDRF